MLVRLGNQAPLPGQVAVPLAEVGAQHCVQVQLEHAQKVVPPDSRPESFMPSVLSLRGCSILANYSLSKIFEGVMLLINEEVVHDELVAAVKLEELNEVCADNLASAKQASQTGKEVQDGVDLPGVVYLRSGELEVYHCLRDGVDIDLSVLPTPKIEAIFLA